VFAIAEDLAARGVRRDELLPQVQLIARAELPRLLRVYGRIWQW
jgi:sulfur transfer complex TusBCD TusB component (DsrH family)